MATRRFATFGEGDGDGDGDGDAFLLAAADMLLVSLLPRSIDRCRRDEWDFDFIGMIAVVPARPAAGMFGMGEN